MIVDVLSLPRHESPQPRPAAKPVLVLDRFLGAACTRRAAARLAGVPIDQVCCTPAAFVIEGRP